MRPDAPEERDWVFTFGANHQHPATGEPLADRYIVIHGTAESARMLMYETFAWQWSMQYPGREEAGVDRFGLTELVTA